MSWFAILMSLIISGSAHGLPPCAYEDGSGGSVPCVWDAQLTGNGLGSSYVIFTVE